MKTLFVRRIVSLMTVSLALISCGIQKQAGTVYTSTNQTSNVPMVQTSFFGASFGDSGEYAVKSTMTRGGIGFDWHHVKKGEWSVPSVSFAGHDWYAALIDFADQRFCRIAFADRYDSEEEAVEELNKMRSLLEKKYELRHTTLNGEYEYMYSYCDPNGNTVLLNVGLVKDIKSKPWTMSLVYSWHKALSIIEEKALNEI